MGSWSGGFDCCSWVGIRTQYIVGGVKRYSAGMNRGVGRTERGTDGAIMKYFPETDPSHSHSLTQQEIGKHTDRQTDRHTHRTDTTLPSKGVELIHSARRRRSQKKSKFQPSPPVAQLQMLRPRFTRFGGVERPRSSGLAFSGLVAISLFPSHFSDGFHTFPFPPPLPMIWFSCFFLLNLFPLILFIDFYLFIYLFLPSFPSFNITPIYIHVHSQINKKLKPIRYYCYYCYRDRY